MSPGSVEPSPFRVITTSPLPAAMPRASAAPGPGRAGCTRRASGRLRRTAAATSVAAGSATTITSATGGSARSISGSPAASCTGITTVTVGDFRRGRPAAGVKGEEGMAVLLWLDSDQAKYLLAMGQQLV